MRVLFNTKPFLLSNKTGVGYYAFNLYLELLKSGIDIIPTLDTKSQTVVKFLSRTSSLARRLMKRWYPSIVGNIGDSLIRSLLQKKENNKPLFDIYHETSLDPMPDMPMRNVCTVHDLSFLSCPELLPGDFVKKAEADISRNVSIADRIIVTSDFVKGEVVHFLRVPEERIDVIPLAAAVFVRQDVKVSKAVRLKFAPKDYLLYVGTLDPRKNLKTLIRAFREINVKYGLALVIAGGSGWRYDDIISYPEELGIKDNVIFTGYVDQETLLNLYNNALAFVYPSLYEGFGLPPLEAMECGVPVIVSNIPPLIEVVGDAAMSFTPHDYKELAGLLDKLISSVSLRSDMIKKGASRAKDYSWKKVAESTVRTYERALKG